MEKINGMKLKRRCNLEIIEKGSQTNPGTSQPGVMLASDLIPAADNESA
jgi:hypothetical protein